jgi:hypothetical protein
VRESNPLEPLFNIYNKNELFWDGQPQTHPVLSGQVWGLESLFTTYSAAGSLLVMYPQGGSFSPCSPNKGIFSRESRGFAVGARPTEGILRTSQFVVFQSKLISISFLRLTSTILSSQYLIYIVEFSPYLAIVITTVIS